MKNRTDDKPVTDDCLQQLSNNKEVIVVVITENQRITHEGIIHLSKMSQLRCLALEGYLATDADLDAISKLSKLEVLVLAGGNFTDNRIAKLRDSLPDCNIDIRK